MLNRQCHSWTYTRFWAGSRIDSWIMHTLQFRAFFEMNSRIVEFICLPSVLPNFHLLACILSPSICLTNLRLACLFEIVGCIFSVHLHIVEFRAKIRRWPHFIRIGSHLALIITLKSADLTSAPPYCSASLFAAITYIKSPAGQPVSRSPRISQVVACLVNIVLEQFIDKSTNSRFIDRWRVDVAASLNRRFETSSCIKCIEDCKYIRMVGRRNRSNGNDLSRRMDEVLFCFEVVLFHQMQDSRNGALKPPKVFLILLAANWFLFNAG